MTAHLAPINKQAALVVGAPIKLTKQEELQFERESINARLEQMKKIPRQCRSNDYGVVVEDLKSRIVEIKEQLIGFDQLELKNILIQNLKDHIGEQAFRRILDLSKSQALSKSTSEARK